MHLLNASASQIHRIGLFGHHFQVIALDGNPVPTPQLVDVIKIAPGERVDAIVEMNLLGVWILGELRDTARQSGMGIVVEYGNQAQPRPPWLPPANARWDYTYDPKNGIREFIVGTGGETLDPVVTTTVTSGTGETNLEDPSGNPNFNAMNLEAGATGNYWGVMALTLDQHGYEWYFESALKAPLAGAPASPTFTDMGSGTCHSGPVGR